MRTTLDIDDDVLEAVKSLAREFDQTPGAILSDLARRALRASFVPFGSRGGLVTNELIDRLREVDAC